ncbi:MAG: hypothetical protein HKN47_28500, partial [Pirellulaceae bacterium]|nr:hypothetical protein [Pirellulaceae bacterium]
VVGTVSVTDADPGQSHTFQIDGGTGANTFTLDQAGRIRVREGVTLDFEQNNAYTLELSVVDNGSPLLADTATINIEIVDVDEPAKLQSNTASVGENAIEGTVLAILELVDPEGFPENYAIALLNVGDGANFVLDPVSLELKVAAGAVFDFETDPLNELTFEIVDLTGQSETSRVNFLVQITDQNDPPRVLTTRITVSELAAVGDILGQLRFADTDQGETFTAEIVGGTGAEFFQVDPVTHLITLKEGAQLDADAGNSLLTLEIRVTDSGGLTGDGIVEVRLNNVNEPPKINDNLQVPAAISGQQFQFTLPQDWIVDPEGGSFQVSIYLQDGDGNPIGLPSWLKFNQSTRTLSGLPDPNFLGNTTLTLRAFEFGSLNLFSTATFTIEVQEGNAPFTNAVRPWDVDNNGRATPNDILSVVNFLLEFGVQSARNGNRFVGFVDVNGDGLVTPVDILLVINELIRQAFTQLQGEAIDYLDPADDREDAIDAAFNDIGASSLF